MVNRLKLSEILLTFVKISSLSKILAFLRSAVEGLFANKGYALEMRY